MTLMMMMMPEAASRAGCIPSRHDRGCVREQQVRAPKDLQEELPQLLQITATGKEGPLLPLNLKSDSPTRSTRSRQSPARQGPPTTRTTLLGNKDWA